jgi:hypothetical protein
MAFIMKNKKKNCWKTVGIDFKENISILGSTQNKVTDQKSKTNGKKGANV